MYLKRGACAAVKRDAKFLSRYLKGVTFVNTKHEGVLFLAQMVKGKRLGLGLQPPPKKTLLTTPSLGETSCIRTQP